jgi:hypothetical protein
MIDGPVEGGHPVGLSSADVCVAVQQRFRGLPVLALASIGQRRERRSGWHGNVCRKDQEQGHLERKRYWAQASGGESQSIAVGIADHGR